MYASFAIGNNPLSIFRIYSNLIEFRITDELILWCVSFACIG